MLQPKKRKSRPAYKKLPSLRQNVLNKKKILKFRAEKWFRLKMYFKRQQRFFKRNKIHDHLKFKLPKFAGYGTSMKQKFKNSMRASKIFNLYYGGFTKKQLKKKIKIILRRQVLKPLIFNPNKDLLIHFESRLDTILYKSHFTTSIRHSQQLISHGHILVNDKITRVKDIKIKKGDRIAVNSSSKTLILNNVKQSNFRPIPPKYLIINYKTLEIIFGNITEDKFYSGFPFWLDITSVVHYYKNY